MEIKSISSFLAVVFFMGLFPESSLCAEKPAAKQIVRIGYGAEPRELDPQKAVGHPESKILQNLFEGLTSFDPITLDPIPAAAESWTISKDNLTYTFKLRPGLKWSDGKPITSEDFVYSWRRLLSPALASEYSYIIYSLKNAEAFN
ncbi:MAG: peptide ABC transporter substrate-binding protein, partial [Oligoflexales bacterium]|nr:peptide ABC transporter substrate-binding protein [Oligoflexales bacterium]